MKTILSLVLVSIISIIITFLFFYERIDAGHVGVKVNLYGDDKGVSQVTEVTGGVFYSPFTSSIYEFPVYNQHKEYTGDASFNVTFKGGSIFKTSVIIDYSVLSNKVPYIFSKYRQDLPHLEEGYIKTAVFNAFRVAANQFSPDDLINNKIKFDNEVYRILNNQLYKEGFVISPNIASILEYPESLKRAIDAKNNAVQNALAAENRVKTAEANAKIKIANSTGNAEAMLIEARAKAEANRLQSASLTEAILKKEWIDAWRSGGAKAPYYISGPGSEKFIISR